MKITKIIILFIIVLHFYQDTVNSQVPEMNFKQFEPLLNRDNDSTYVVNFWATWCVPCRKEIPAFEKLQESYKTEKLKILLISLDFPNQLDSNLIPYIEKNSVESEVILLNDPDANAWIDKVSPSWSGAIPATLIYNNNFRRFHEGAFTYEELESIIKQIL